MDNETLLKVLKACEADFERTKAEYGNSAAAANDLWGIHQVREIITAMLKGDDTPRSITGAS